MRTLTFEQLKTLKPCNPDKRAALFDGPTGVSAALNRGASIRDILWVAGALGLKRGIVEFAKRATSRADAASYAAADAASYAAAAATAATAATAAAYAATAATAAADAAAYAAAYDAAAYDAAAAYAAYAAEKEKQKRDLIELFS